MSRQDVGLYVDGARWPLSPGQKTFTTPEPGKWPHLRTATEGRRGKCDGKVQTKHKIYVEPGKHGCCRLPNLAGIQTASR